MTKCPNCKKEVTKLKKSWTYGVFNVDAYRCDCGTKFREYTSIHVIVAPTSENASKLEKHSFTLKLEKHGWVKI